MRPGHQAMDVSLEGSPAPFCVLSICKTECTYLSTCLVNVPLMGGKAWALASLALQCSQPGLDLRVHVHGIHTAEEAATRLRDSASQHHTNTTERLNVPARLKVARRRHYAAEGGGRWVGGEEVHVKWHAE